MIELSVKGMSCGHCVKTVTQAVQAIDPKALVTVDLAAGTVCVQSTAPGATPTAVTQAIEDAGYDVAR